MRKGQLFVLSLLVFSAMSAAIENVADNEQSGTFVGQDLHLQGKKLVSYQPSTGEHTLVFEDGFSMSIGANRFSSESAVVWLETVTTEYRGRVRIDYNATVYLQGEIHSEKDKTAKATAVSESVIEEGESMVVRFAVTGEVFATADKREVADPRGLEIYQKASSAAVPEKPKFVVQPQALVPELEPEEIRPVVAKKPGLVERLFGPKEKKVRPVVVEPEEEVAVKKPGFIEKLFGVRKEKVEEKEVVRRRTEFVKAVEQKRIEVERAEEKKPRFMYPINIAPAGKVEPKIEKAPSVIEGRDIATVIGRFYLWQKIEEEGTERLLELQADNAVIFYVGEQLEVGEEVEAGPGDVLARGAVEAIYLSGDVVMTEGQRTVRADEMYYDFLRKKAVAVNAVMRSFDAGRGIPIYVRAAKLHQIAENIFAAENITLTSSEFYLPQISLNASSVIITDTTEIDERLGRLSDSSYDAEMRDVRMKVGRNTIFYWPFVRSNLKRPDIPLKSVHAGYDNTWGMSVETRWYLARLLGLREPAGTDSTLALDYYGKRGVGGGAEIEYTRQDYYGRLLGYIIRDSGEDELGRHRSRQGLEPDRKLRGRFYWMHRHFLPYNWQLTGEFGYASDEHFIESYYRHEYNVGRQETYIHLKRIEDNWGLSFLGKARINDFDEELEELPSAEFHLTGQSLFDDRFTLYSDLEASRLRQRIGKDHSIAINEERFSFLSSRTELDLPIQSGEFKIVPYVASMFGYDDRSGFTRTLVDGSNTGSFGKKDVWIGEAGVRVSMQPFWKVYPNVKSRLWDLNQLRHILKPHLTASLFTESDSVVEQRDTLNFGISQRLQTKRRAYGSRGGADQQDEKMRTVDWMRLDTDFTWVNNSASGGADTGPDRFIWNRPIIPLRVLSAPEIFSGDLTNNLHRFEMYGPRRNYFSADYMWRVSDTSVILSDINYDMQDGVVQQFNFGLAHLHWPNLSLYIGNRYLRRIEILEEKGSNAFTFAATYVLDPRYTIVFAQQFDFDYGANIRSDISLIRRYHRLYWAITYSADESLDRQAVVFSIWPEGIEELAIGPRRYTELGRAGGY
jgi:hypothetical protein